MSTAEIIYLDNNATTPLAPQVAGAMHACAQRQHANPASQHEPGRSARRVIETAREQIARQLGAVTSAVDSDQLIFTSGATEANNLALRGLAGLPPARIIVSAVEHPSVKGPAEWLASEGFDVQWLGVDSNGVVDLNRLEQLLTDQTRVVSVTFGSSDTGVIQPVERVAKICSEAAVPLHTDAAQAVGKIAIDFRGLDVSLLSCSAHKFHGPSGIGALLVRHGVGLSPILYGGFQQSGLRPGTENVEAVIGMQAALELADTAQPPRGSYLEELRNYFEQLLCDQLSDIVIHGAAVSRLPQTSNISFIGLDRQALVMALDLAGIACSTGSACASGSSDPSPTLFAMGVSAGQLHSALRFSLGATNTRSHIDAAVCRIVATVQDLRRRQNGPTGPEPARRRSEKTL